MGRVRKHHIDFFEALSALYLLLLVFLVIVIAYQLDLSIFIVLLGYVPTVVVICLSIVIHEHYAEHKSWLWLIPLLINTLFYFVASATPAIATEMDVGLLIGANALLSIIYMIIVSSVFLDDFKKQLEEKKAPAPEPRSLQDYIHSIEDKSKALNFVVGRVYSKYRGGSRDLRAQLRIPAEWYNEFSLLGVGTERIDKEKLLELIERFDKQLQLYTKTEKEVFGYESNNLTNLIRDPKGTDRIIDVLDRNDKDPAKSYFEGAKEFCQKIREEVQTNSLKLVKNEYIPKDEEELAEIRGDTQTKETITPKAPTPKLVEKKTSTDRRSAQDLGGLPGEKKDIKHP